MTQEEKQLLHEAQLGIEHILRMLCPSNNPIANNVSGPSFEKLKDTIDCLRVFVEYELLDLEATRREKIDLEKQLRDKH